MAGPKQPFSVKIPPGVVRGATPIDTPGTWYDSQLVRWTKGVMHPCAGWDRLAFTAVDPKIYTQVRAMHEWQDTQGRIWRAYLCDKQVYVENEGAITDITPSGFVGPEGDFAAGGYGDDIYSYGTYGTPRPNQNRIRAVGPAFSINNWGQQLVFMTSYDGRLHYWDPIAGGGAQPVAGAPTANRLFVVTPSRHIVIFGLGGNYRRWGWCSQEDYNDWDFNSDTNTAGFYDLEPASPIVAASTVGSSIIFFTVAKAIVSNYIGVPYIFNYNDLAEGVTPVSHQAIVEHGDQASWLADNGFWNFDGSTLSDCQSTLFDFYNADVNKQAARYRVSAVYLGMYNEVWWLYPNADVTENNRYISWDYSDKWWAKGSINRTCGLKASYNSYPLMAKWLNVNDGSAIFRHEFGNIYSGENLPFVESGSFNIMKGAVMCTLQQYVANDGVKEDTASVYYTFYGSFQRSGDPADSDFVYGPTVKNLDGYVDVDETARDWRIRLATGYQNAPPWTVGEMLFYAVQRGSR